MLVLTRRPNAGDQSVLSIGSDIEVTVTEIRGDQVRLGVNAPRETSVDRLEIWQEKQSEKALQSPQEGAS